MEDPLNEIFSTTKKADFKHLKYLLFTRFYRHLVLMIHVWWSTITQLRTFFLQVPHYST